MKVIDNEIGENGLSRILVRNGFGDLKVKIGENEITCVRSILMNGNEVIRKLLLDEKQSEILELYEECDMESFFEIEKYYSGGCMELNETNVINILRFSIYYNDNRIMRLCKKYLKSHMNDSIMCEIFSILNGLNINRLNELKEISEDYIKRHGFKYLNDDILLLKLNLIGLKLIMNNDELIIKNENWLLNRLMLWYMKVLKRSEEEEENEEELNEFISIIKTRIHLNEIRIEEISEEVLKELLKLKIDINVYQNHHINVNVDEVQNVELIEIVNEYYLNEDKEMILTENEKNLLNSEEVKIEILKLLCNENIKIVEIVLIIMMEMKISEIIPKETKSELLGIICVEYNKSKRNRTMKCLCLFVDDVESITTMKYLCGKEILYRILNEEYNLNSKSKELLMKYIQESQLSNEEVEEMSEIILNRDLLEKLLIKEIRSFSYPQSEYSFFLNEEFSMIPSSDGSKCEFSIFPSLPSGIRMNKENGIINGKVENAIEKKEYEIICKNMRNEKKFKILLEFIDIKFTELNKNPKITISNNGKVITSTNNGCSHCYLNMKMENGIYHIKYQIHQNQSNDYNMMLGLSTDNTFSGTDICSQSTTCNYWAYSGGCNITSYCYIGTVVNKNPNCNNHGDGSIYEVIVDMNKREFWISHNNSSPVLLVKDLPSPLYPYALPYRKYTSIELLSVSHQN